MPHPVAGSTPVAASRHLPELDGVRGIAIIAVLLTHSASYLNLLPGAGVPWANATRAIFYPGWGGVDLFFTLSGFLITGILLRARKSSSYFKSFYMRRILRILPIYYLFLIATTLFTRSSFFPQGIVPLDVRTRLPYFFYLQNWPVFWTDWAGMGSIWGIYWSLAVEEQFYMVWPAIVRVFRLRTIFVICTIGYLLGWPVRAYLFHKMGLDFGIMQSPFTRLDGLFLGAAIAIYREAYGRPVPLSWGAWIFAAGAAVYASIAIFHYPELGSGIGVHIDRDGVTAFALMSAGLVVATQYPIRALHRILSLWPLQLAGRLSYGMYVYHLFIFKVFMHVFRYAPRTNPLVALLDVSMCLITVVAVAELSFRFIETPFLRLKRFFPSPPAPVSQS
jgi:peptidoglycan/LPS O-acetylase OafA/YrhL